MHQKIKNSEFGYLGNPSVKRDGIESEFTKDEVIEYQKCMRDPAYFARKYIKIISLDEGLVPFDLYPYQEKMSMPMAGKKIYPEKLPAVVKNVKIVTFL